MHAARNYGVSVNAVTLSRQQAEWGLRLSPKRGSRPKLDARWTSVKVMLPTLT